MLTKGSTAIEGVPVCTPAAAGAFLPRPSQKAVAATSTAMSTPIGTRIFQRFAGGAALITGCEPDGAAAMLALEALAAAEPDTEVTGCGGSSTTALHDDSVSRFRRLRSARISEAT